VPDELRYIAATGMVGAGFHADSMRRGVARRPHFIAADGGSTDPGPYQLGSGTGIFSRESCKRDLRLSLEAARELGVPFLVGSCGGAGTDLGVDLFAELIREVAKEKGLRLRIGRVYAEPDRNWLKQRMRAGRVHPLTGAPVIDEGSIDRAAHIVAMMGAEPFARALEQGADVVLAGRSSDTSIYSAIPEREGYDPGLVWHAAKIIECGSAAAGNRTGQDSMLCLMRRDHFVVEPLHPDFNCTPVSVAAHSLYENADPFQLVEPAGTLDTTESVYTAVDDRTVRVEGSVFVPTTQYTVKLEAAELAGYQSITMGGVRDPVILRQLDSWIESMRRSIEWRVESSAGMRPDEYELGMRVYGRDGTLGPLEPTPRLEGHEAFLLMDATAPTQEQASTVIRLASHVAMHHPVPEWRGSITGIAHPYAPATIDRGPVYRFTMNHVVELDDPLEPYRIEIEEVGA
jgi:hypothetical protein